MISDSSVNQNAERIASAPPLLEATQLSYSWLDLSAETVQTVEKRNLE